MLTSILSDARGKANTVLVNGRHLVPLYQRTTGKNSFLSFLDFVVFLAVCGFLDLLRRAHVTEEAFDRTLWFFCLDDCRWCCCRCYSATLPGRLRFTSQIQTQTQATRKHDDIKSGSDWLPEVFSNSRENQSC